MTQVKPKSLKSLSPQHKLRGIAGFHPSGRILLDILAASCGEMPFLDYIDHRIQKISDGTGKKLSLNSDFKKQSQSQVQPLMW